ncbi:MAG: type I DNA topoisomerase, partial [Planctomycetes bacterium]|nr:type I DNA topoisomerase [Planctomycetota bacterium]
MGRSLVIVESPAKAKTINQYLGKQFIVKSSVGHVRDLPRGASKDKKAPAKRVSTKGMTDKQKAALKKKREAASLIKNMGINPEKDWEARYEILPGKEKVVAELQKYAENADHIYLATDLDREGEAIAWHLREAIGGDHDRYSRVTFSEITKKAIQAAFEVPGELNMDRVYAQQARRFLDRVVGFMLSPLLWKRVARGLSAGRVQSVAVRLVVEREREIRAFIPDEYWDVSAVLLNNIKLDIPAAVSKFQGKPYKPVNEEQAMAAVNAVQAGTNTVTTRLDKGSSSKPHSPYITSTLQQAASVRLGFGVKKTMMLAQRLYEGGYITYMRTDSTNLSNDAVEQCRGHIAKTYGKEYLPEKPLVYSSKKNAQEAHEAIRPSDVSIGQGNLSSNIDKDGKRLYELIWRQFVSCQMTNAQFDNTTLLITNGD